jgi:ArsR family transcriptional regulator
MKNKRVEEEWREEWSVLCKALGHPLRVQMLRLLLQHECVCGEVVNALPIGYSTVSEYLSILKEAGLVQDEGDSPHRYYHINKGLLKKCKKLVAAP